MENAEMQDKQWIQSSHAWANHGNAFILFFFSNKVNVPEINRAQFSGPPKIFFLNT